MNGKRMFHYKLKDDLELNDSSFNSSYQFHSNKHLFDLVPFSAFT